MIFFVSFILHISRLGDLTPFHIISQTQFSVLTKKETKQGEISKMPQSGIVQALYMQLRHGHAFFLIYLIF